MNWRQFYESLSEWQNVDTLCEEHKAQWCSLIEKTLKTVNTSSLKNYEEKMNGDQDSPGWKTALKNYCLEQLHDFSCNTNNMNYEDYIKTLTKEEIPDYKTMQDELYELQEQLYALAMEKISFEERNKVPEECPKFIWDIYEEYHHLGASCFSKFCVWFLNNAIFVLAN